MNIIKKLRRELHLTVDDLAREVNVTKNYIQKVEKGLYHAPSVDLVNYLAGQQEEYTAGDILQAYAEEQNSTPWDLMGDLAPMNWEVLDRDFDMIDWHDAHKHPYAWVRMMVCGFYGLPESQIKWAEMHRIHPAILSKYELSKTATIPTPCREALLRAGVPIVLINKIIAEGKKRHDNHS